jgi:hypothetical protein
MAEAETEVAEKKKHPIEITVNNKPVEIQGPEVTGLQIKQAAIAQHVAIEVDFQLAEIRHNGEQHIVGDADHVTVTKKSKFVATAPDDNS